MSKQRLVIIDIMQGLAMTLVVLGHHLFAFSPDWYKYFHFYLYTFHMPLFIFISGFLIRYSYKDICSLRDYIEYVKKRFIKFTIPYIIIGIIVALISNKLFDWGNILKDIGYLIYSPKQGPAIFLWYIYLLLFFYIISPFIIRTCKILKIILVVLGIVGYLLNLSVSYFCIDYFTKYFIFYLLGIIAAENIEFIKQTNIHLLYILTLFFIVSSYSLLANGYNKFVVYNLAFSSIPTIYYISKVFFKSKYIKYVLVSISKNCFVIYLFHMFFVQLLSKIWIKIGINNDVTYISYLILSSVLSICISIILPNIITKIKKG